MTKMMDLDKLAEQTMGAVKKTLEDLELVKHRKMSIKSVVILMTDVLTMQVVQASLTLAFLERWAEDG